MNQRRFIPASFSSRGLGCGFLFLIPFAVIRTSLMFWFCRLIKLTFSVSGFLLKPTTACFAPSIFWYLRAVADAVDRLLRGARRLRCFSLSIAEQSVEEVLLDFVVYLKAFLRRKGKIRSPREISTKAFTHPILSRDIKQLVLTPIHGCISLKYAERNHMLSTHLVFALIPFFIGR